MSGPVRVTEAERIVEPGRTVERVRVVEYAPAAAAEQVAALPRPYDPALDNWRLRGTCLRYVPPAPPGTPALPPTPRRRWWFR